MESFSEPGLDAFIFDQLIVNITGAQIPAQTWAHYCEWSLADREPGDLLGSFIWAPTYALSGEQRRALAAADRRHVMQVVRFDRAAVEQQLSTSSVAFANLARAG